MVRINDYGKYTPDELRHELMGMKQDGSPEAFTNLLCASVVLTQMVADLQNEISKLKIINPDTSGR